MYSQPPLQAGRLQPAGRALWQGSLGCRARPMPPLPERCQAGARQKPGRAVHGSRRASSLDARWSPCRKGRGNGALPGQGAGGKRAPERRAGSGARKAGWACRRQSGDLAFFLRHLPSRVSSQGQGVQASPRLLSHGAVRREESIFLINTIIYLKRSKYCVLKDCDEF